MFELFDPKGELTTRQGNLPHWFQPGVTYFVTFRLDDSVPQTLSRAWHRRRDDWLRRNGFDPASPNWKSRLRESSDAEREYNVRFTREFMNYLDRGYGSCMLRDERFSNIVATSLRSFDGVRYYLGDFVVMPNHVHLLACLIGKVEIERQCESWKRFTATEINRALGRRGRLWQAESFDHMVRSISQFDYLQRYIAENPVKARLRSGEYLLYSTLGPK